ncbi:uncharacterized protein EV422DRAFT_563219 [Fimicolochytrium jonesii]|uniref:uncharacterized protein n=1 Tax=Fimicolochytrium jonesii TaxID=1396493 RepID=UPI0022FE4AF7|nr:uncharacterized protein EV422DRAFT_563219 [Fimicolochytrium jonesii]KAI8827141.1 hypothetical protein EV422DRAFT_563219 [Fimicolochytrium jonesii]
MISVLGTVVATLALIYDSHLGRPFKLPFKNSNRGLELTDPSDIIRYGVPVTKSYAFSLELPWQVYGREPGNHLAEALLGIYEWTSRDDAKRIERHFSDLTSKALHLDQMRRLEPRAHRTFVLSLLEGVTDSKRKARRLFQAFEKTQVLDPYLIKNDAVVKRRLRTVKKGQDDRLMVLARMHIDKLDDELRVHAFDHLDPPFAQLKAWKMVLRSLICSYGRLTTEVGLAARADADSLEAHYVERVARFNDGLRLYTPNLHVGYSGSNRMSDNDQDIDGLSEKFASLRTQVFQLKELPQLLQHEPTIPSFLIPEAIGQSMELNGRKDALQCIVGGFADQYAETAIPRNREGHPIYVVASAPGMGKTRLLTELPRAINDGYSDVHPAVYIVSYNNGQTPTKYDVEFPIPCLVLRLLYFNYPDIYRKFESFSHFAQSIFDNWEEQRIRKLDLGFFIVRRPDPFSLP